MKMTILKRETVFLHAMSSTSFKSTNRAPTPGIKCLHNPFLSRLKLTNNSERFKESANYLPPVVMVNV